MNHDFDDEDFPRPATKRATVLDMAREIIAMDDENQELRHLAARGREYERKYNDLLNESLQHGQEMMGNLFQLGMKLAGEKVDAKRITS